MMHERLIQLLELLEETPGDPFLLFALAKEYEKLEDTDQALDYYLFLEQSHPDYVGLYYHLGKLYETLDQPDRALATYQKGMEIARAQKDQHSFSELQNAKTNLEIGG
ncbi:MAG: tetratricopeptide repeat protein [Haliscomenobacter sp.]|nr:tetratricopeptide repeat protein [Haliscomenobacter sp.]MBK8656518.1 tetratricopeptide repeat protein [Haliscomenobacter sp.]